jgi:transcriptional regulator with XRE-family HTH domain
MPPAAPTPDSTEAAIRTHFGLSQRDLARYLGVSQGLLGHYETGRRPAPPAVVQRLTPLALLLPPPEGYGPPDPPAPTPTPENPAALPGGPATPLAAEPLRRRAHACRLEAARLTQQLHRQHRAATALARRHRGLAQLAAALRPTADAATAHWLAGLAADLAAADPGPAAASALVLLAVRRDALLAEAAALEKIMSETA